MRWWKQVLAGIITAIVVAGLSGAVSSRVVTERRLSTLEATVNNIHEDVLLIKKKLIGD